MNEKESEEILDWALGEIEDIISTVKNLENLSKYKLHLMLLRRIFGKYIH